MEIVDEERLELLEAPASGGPPDATGPTDVRADVHVNEERPRQVTATRGRLCITTILMANPPPAVAWRLA